jgi:F-type H+-transporting ATPase subunit delta
MSYENIARRWGRAVFELGKESNTLPALNRDMTSFAELYAGNDELSGVLENPLVPEPSREAIIRDVADRLGLSETAKNTLRLLGKKRRIVAVPEIARHLARLVDVDAGVVRAEVTSAGPLTEAYLGRLKGELEKATGKTVVISHKQDKSLIGGVITRLGDQVIDGSVRARLDGFSESLLRA